jgi:3-hydroxyisobutyrate dehydrogenase-like beta-hydroxyacid dehydrogenase
MGRQPGGWGLVPGIRLARDLTLGLLGLGEIGRAMARIAQAFEMPALYWDIARFPEFEARYGIRYVEWDEVFRRSDAVSVHLALNEATQGIVGAALMLSQGRCLIIAEPATAYRARRDRQTATESRLRSEKVRATSTFAARFCTRPAYA